ncbi:MAG: hypothetical protein HDR38_08805 [Treponema sp.]|nr:hypothetical protein [Treponema sp.]
MKIPNDAAILLGNGINRYCESNFKTATCCSWNDLLKALADDEGKRILGIKSMDIPYPEFFDLLCLRSEDDDYENLKPAIKQEVEHWKSFKIHKNLTNFAIEHDIPIITTNYDTTLLTDDLKEKNKKVAKKFKKTKVLPNEPVNPLGKKAQTYPWTFYYSDREVKDCLKEFAIWHMHGFSRYPKSLVIGMYDYARVIKKIRDFYSDKWHEGKTEKTQYSIKNIASKSWKKKERNSWLTVFFNKDLYIIGLGLSSYELSVRWLLLQRERFFKKYPERRKRTVFVYSSQERMTRSKKFFLETAGIETEKHDYDEIYSSWKIE